MVVKIIQGIVFGGLGFMIGLGIFPSACRAAAPSQAAPSSAAITLPEAITLALRYNRGVKSAYMSRVLQRFNLKVSLDKFNPNLTLNSSASLSGTRTDTEGSDGTSRSSSSSVGSTVQMDKLFESGASFAFSWARDDAFSDSNAGASDWNGTNTWSVSITQPLLKGFGKELNRASVVLAEMSEQSSLLSFRDTIISTVDATISAFRTYAKAIRQVEISKASVERSRANLANNQLLVSMGRMAPNEIIQTESDLANQELSYEATLNSLESARLAFFDVLDLPTDTPMTPVEETDLTPVHPDFDTCLKTAFSNRSDYINAQLNVRSAEIGMMQAEDNMKWDLNATGGYTVTDANSRQSANSDSGSWNLGLSLSVPLYGDLSREQSLLSAQTSLSQSQLSLKETQQSITLGVKDAIREVETSLKQVGMATRARELSEKKLAVEKEKLALGRSTTFQVVSYQNDLVSSLESELSAKVAYLNALKALDTYLGTTLDTWKIDYNKEFDKWPGK